MSPSEDWAVESDQEFAQLGYSVGTAGDVNGDGYADVIVGSPFYDNGRVLVYYGNDGLGLSMRPQQRRSDDSTPIGPLGMSDDPDGFRLALLGRAPYGRSGVKLELEVKPLGTEFDGIVSSVSDAWADTGTTGVELNELVSDLTAGMRYHWRVRLRYDPATTPFQQASRWLTVPWNGWEETDLRTLAEADISLAQTDSPDPVLVGREVTYTIDVANSGPASIDVSVRDVLPAGVTFVSATPSQGTCSESAGEVDCDLGEMADGGTATVIIVITTLTAGVKINTATVYLGGRDPDIGDNTASEETTVRNLATGDFVWDDQNGDGIQDAGEPGMAGVVVALYDGVGTYVSSTGTDSSGNYSLTGLVYGTDYYIRFNPPEGYVLTGQDHGGDDLKDSDADPYTWKTPVFSLVDGDDPVRWDAGMIPNCIVPDETVYIYDMTLTDDGNDYPVLNFQDPNQPSQVTGYNVYRSSDAGLPPGEWPLVASDVIDMDESEPNLQWVDSSGDISPTGVWYYDIAAYNHRCPAEGPR